MNPAFSESFTISNICKSFEKTGIYPFNSKIFTDDDFLPSSITDRPDPTSIINQDTPLVVSQSKGDLPQNDNILDQPSTSFDPNQPSTSGIVKRNTTEEGREELGIVSPEMLRPYPTAPLRKKSRTGGRKKGKCSIITDTPEKDELMKANEERNNKSKKKGAKTKKVAKDEKKNVSLVTQIQTVTSLSTMNLHPHGILKNI